MAPPYDVVLLDSIASTQDEAGNRFSRKPVLVVAAHQTGGRGRAGRPWQSAPRALAASLAFAPWWPLDTWGRLSLAAGVAARAVLGEVDLEWPNDLMVAGDKIGGVLLETEGQVVTAGLGVNLWWPSKPQGIGALHFDDPGAGLAVELAHRWAGDLLARVAAGPDRWGLDEYRAVCLTIGRSVRWEPDGRGLARDVAPSGELVVVTEAGERRLSSGEVWEVRYADMGGDP
jgi:BirA family biotin operon repressor/biotin-[acetyl-CoA-carboxylase] ligase